MPQFLHTDAAFGLHVGQLTDRIYQQMEEALLASGLKVPAKITGIVQLLYSEGPQSQAAIAQQLKLSHQLAAQRLTWLFKEGMAVAETDPNDKRRKLIRLTETGSSEGGKLQDFLPDLIKAYHDLFDEVGLHLNEVILQADEALARRSLTDRFVGKETAQEVNQ